MGLSGLRKTAFAALMTLAWNGAALACQPNYVVADGDALFTIAEANLGDVTKWSLISPIACIAA